VIDTLGLFSKLIVISSRLYEPVMIPTDRSLAEEPSYAGAQNARLERSDHIGDPRGSQSKPANGVASPASGDFGSLPGRCSNRSAAAEVILDEHPDIEEADFLAVYQPAAEVADAKSG
jgi:hypothetical protein